MKHLPDDILRMMMGPRLAALKALAVPAAATAPAEKSANQEPPRARQQHAQEAKPQEKKPAHAEKERRHPHSSDEERAAELSEGERDFLQSILDRPNLTTTQRRDYLGLSTYKNDQLKKSVLAKQLAEEIAINLGHATRGNVKFLELAGRGYQALGKEPQPARPQNCSAEHWWYQRTIAAWYREQGIEAQIELCRRGKRADIGIAKDGRLIAIEVAMTPHNEAVNAQKDLEAGFDAVLIACKNARVRTAVEERLRIALSESQRARVKVMLVSDASFLKSICKAS